MKSFTIIIAYWTEMCYTLIVSFTTIYSVPGKDAEGCEEGCDPCPFPAKESLLLLVVHLGNVWVRTRADNED